MTPLHRQIVVAATAGRAFAVFTTEIGLWWPLERFSVGGTSPLPTRSLERASARPVQRRGNAIWWVLGTVPITRHMPDEHRLVESTAWLSSESGRRESNPHSQLGKLMFCH